jgi:CubicO group peptidase (beta-lactamase class C family)
MLDDTVAARGPILVRHLLTSTLGLGIQFAPTPHSEILRGFGWGPNPPDMSPDEFMARIGSLPLTYQPGERWQYQTSADILSVFLARVAGRPLHDLLRERITEPLGMTSTRFPTREPEGLPTQYRPTTEGLVEAVEYERAFVGVPPFESLGGGLISTVPDYLAFLAALADGALLPGDIREQFLSDQLTPGQREGITEMVGPDTSWGWQVSVQTGPGLPWTSPGRYGWTGGSGTSAYVDPSRDLIGVVFSQRFMAGPREDFAYFWEPLAASV